MLSSYNHFGQNRIHFEEIDSTNLYAIQLLSKTNPIDGTVITADYQTVGKGQYDRIWASERGKNIILSIILKPEWLSAQHHVYLNMAIALGIHDFLSKFNVEFKIKWPNDLYHQQQKIGGILIQNQLQGQTIKNSIVGIGININQIIFQNDVMNAISLTQISGQLYDLETLITSLLQYLNARYQQLKAKKENGSMKKEFEEKLYGYKCLIHYETQNADKNEGMIVGIDNEGRLSVMTTEGIRSLVHGEVKVHYQ